MGDARERERKGEGMGGRERDYQRMIQGEHDCSIRLVGNF